MSSAFPPNDPFRDPAPGAAPSFGPPQYGASQPQGGPFNPYGPKPIGPQQPISGFPPSTKPPLSKLALTSLIAAIGSALTICLCVPSVIGSVVAVVTGSMAVYRIGKSNGQLGGMPQAIVGLVIGVPLMLLGMVAIPFWFGDRTPAPRSASQRALSRAESMVNNDNNGIAHGNTPEAKALAERFSKTMQELREKLFTKQEKPGFSLSGGQFITWCELHEGRCVFVVHVPAYRKFDDDAKESLAQIAWVAAVAAVSDTLQPGDELAVGMKGPFLYGAVMAGTLSERNRGEDTITPTIAKTESLLLPFFEAENEGEADEEPLAEPVEAPERVIPGVNAPQFDPPNEDTPQDDTPGDTLPIGDGSNPLEGIADQPEDLVPSAPNGPAK